MWIPYVREGDKIIPFQSLNGGFVEASDAPLWQSTINRLKDSCQAALGFVKGSNTHGAPEAFRVLSQVVISAPIETVLLYLHEGDGYRDLPLEKNLLDRVLGVIIS